MLILKTGLRTVLTFLTIPFFELSTTSSAHSVETGTELSLKEQLTLFSDPEIPTHVLIQSLPKNELAITSIDIPVEQETEIAPAHSVGACTADPLLWRHSADNKLVYGNRVTCGGGGFLPLYAKATLEGSVGWPRFATVANTPRKQFHVNYGSVDAALSCRSSASRTYRVWGEVWAGTRKGHGYSAGLSLPCSV